jgi:hypothetical protein
VGLPLKVGTWSEEPSLNTMSVWSDVCATLRMLVL